MQEPLENLNKEDILVFLDKEAERRAKAEKEISDLRFQFAYYKRLAFGQKYYMYRQGGDR